MKTLQFQRLSVNNQSEKVAADSASVVSIGGNNERAVESAPTISVVIPALNEARNIPAVFSALPENIHQLILVDGGSTDDTVTIARSLRDDICVVQQTRKGKGNALACGFEAATGDIIVMLDADGSTNPKEIPAFIEALTVGKADFAKGSRFLEGGGSSDITKIRSWGNKFLMMFVNGFCRTRFSDLCYGYNAFWRSSLPAFGLRPGTRLEDGSTTMAFGDGFEIETLINIRAAKYGLSIIEVPSFEETRLNGESNLRAIPDGIRVIKTIFRELFNGRSYSDELLETSANEDQAPVRLELSA